MNFQNSKNISLPNALLLATNTYDLVPAPNKISATTLMNPIRKIILSKDAPQSEDLADLIQASIGSAIHAAYEAAWQNPSKALRALGYPEHVIDRVRVNPQDPVKDTLDIYTERRTEVEIDGMIVSGSCDLILDGAVHDYKTTSCFVYLNGTNTEKYRLQLSIYRWLNPEIIKKDIGYINFFLKDWSKHEIYKDGYPSSPMPSQELKLMPHQEVEDYVRSKLKELKKYQKGDKSDLPQCSQEDLWQDADIWQYFSKPDAKRATKNFTNESEAYSHRAGKGKGEVRIKKGKCRACNYCAAQSICTQAQSLRALDLLA